MFFMYFLYLFQCKLKYSSIEYFTSGLLDCHLLTNHHHIMDIVTILIIILTLKIKNIIINIIILSKYLQIIMTFPPIIQAILKKESPYYALIDSGYWNVNNKFVIGFRIRSQKILFAPFFNI